MIKTFALNEPASSYNPFPLFRSRWTALAILSVLALGAALRFSAAFTPASLPRLPQILSGVATVALVYLIARDAFGAAAGLLSALFYALSAVAAIQSFARPSNAPAVFFAMLAVYSGLASWNRGRAVNSALSGALIGAAAALDWHTAPLAIFPLLAHLTAHHPYIKRRLALYAGMAATAYLSIETPGLLPIALAWPKMQWSVLPEAHWHHLVSILPIGTGWPLAAAGLAGWLWMGFRLFSKHDFPRARVEAPYIHALLWFYGCAFVFFAQIFMRSDSAADAHPVVPFISILAGCLLAAFGTHPNRSARKLGLAACALVGLYSFAYSAAHVNLYRIESPSERASEWILSNIPRGSSIGIARNDFLTPACLKEYHPHHEVLECGGRDASIEECVFKLGKIKSEARYIVLDEFEYRDYLAGAYADGSPQQKTFRSIFEDDFTEIARFDRNAAFLGFEFAKPSHAPQDWLAPNATIRIFERKRAGFPL